MNMQARAVEAASLNWTAEANGSYFPAGQHNSHTLVLANKEELAAGTIAPEMIALSKEMTVLGRGSPKFPVDVTMVLKKEGKDILSRKHAEIVRLQSGQYMIKDCGATNGIFVNMVKVETRTLQPGDVVQFGGYCNLEFGRKIERSDVCIRYLYNYLQPPQPQPQPRGSSKSASLATSASSFASVSDQSKRSATESVKKRADRSDVLVGVGLGASAAKRKKPSSSHSEVSPVPVQVDNLVLELQAVQAQLAYQSKRHKAELDDLAAQRSSEYSEVQRFLQGSRVETEHLKQLLHGGAEELRIKGEEVLELTGERMLLGQQNGALQALVEEKEGRCRSVDNQLRGLRASLSIATAATSVSTGIGMQCISDETLKKTLQCVICEQTLVDAVILPCSHGFCRTCLELKWSVGRPASSASTSSVCRCPSCNIPAAPRRCKVTPKTGSSAYYVRSDNLDHLLWLMQETSPPQVQHAHRERERAARQTLISLGIDPDAPLVTDEAALDDPPAPLRSEARAQPALSRLPLCDACGETGHAESACPHRLYEDEDEDDDDEEEGDDDEDDDTADIC